MTKPAFADTSAQQTAIPNQGTGPTPSPEKNIGRNPGDQGNTQEEKKSDQPLDMFAQVKLVQKAMNQKHDRNFEQWGVKTLASLLDYQADDGASMDTYITFFRDLLLFLAKPKVSKQFSKSLPNGLKRVQGLSDFFIDLLGHTDYDQFVAYHRMYKNYKEDDSSTFLSYAEDYLTGEDLLRVLAAHGRQIETTEQPAATQHNNGPYLVALLDRYFPGVEWKDDKQVIATHEKMKWFLEYQEEKRIEEERKTPDDKKADEVARQIAFQTEHAFYFRKDSPMKGTPPPADPLLASAQQVAAQAEKAVGERSQPVTKKNASHKPSPKAKQSDKKSSTKKKA